MDSLFQTLQIIRSTRRRYVYRVEDALRDFLQNTQREMTMRKTILTILGVSAAAALTMQTAVAAERHHNRKIDRAPASEQFRNRNAHAAPAYVAVQPEWSRYGGGISAPAGR
jgi:hypothetical protein